VSVRTITFAGRPGNSLSGRDARAAGFVSTGSGQKNPQRMNKQITKLLKFTDGCKIPPKKRLPAWLYLIFNFSTNIGLPRKKKYW
jgi:hypothetical protein